MPLTWRRTIIGDVGQPHDFSAFDERETPIGRTWLRPGPVHSAHAWHWAMNASGPDINRHDTSCSGTAIDKQQAVTMVEMTYTRCLGRSS